MFGLFGKRPAGRRRSSRASSCVLRCEELEPRAVPAGMFVAGVGGITQAADPEVSIYATAGPKANQRLGIQLEAFAGTTGDTRLALGDVNGDGTDDIIAAAGKGGGSAVKIFDGKAALAGTTSVIASFFVYSDQPGVSQNSGFGGGVFVAAADLNGDGFAELVTTPGAGGRGHLKVFDFNAFGSSAVGATFGSFLGSNPTLRASAYTFTDYNGEIRVTTLKSGTLPAVVTSSGAGVPGDVRVYLNLYNLGQIADRTPVPLSFLAFRLTPFGGYTGGLSVAGANVTGSQSSELVVSKNDGASTVAVYDLNSLIFQGGLVGLNTNPAPLTTFEAFTGFNGEVRLGSADVDADGYEEVLTTTGFSGDPQGTPVKAWKYSGGAFALVRSFYSNPGYLPGAWLASGDFTSATDLTNPLVTGSGSSLPATFSWSGFAPDAFVDPQDVGLRFPAAGTLPGEAVTGAGLPFTGLEVSFSFAHFATRTVRVTLRYTSSGAVPNQSIILFDGQGVARTILYNGMSVTFTDGAASTVPSASSVSTLTGRYNADGGSLADFVRNLPDRNGRFTLIFEDGGNDGVNGTVTTTIAPTLRLLY